MILDTPYPDRPIYGAKNRDIDVYAKQLEGALYQCNYDKNMLRQWREKAGEG